MSAAGDLINRNSWVSKSSSSTETKASKADAFKCCKILHFCSHFLLFCNTLTWLFSDTADLANEIMEIIKLCSAVCRGLVALSSGWIFPDLLALWVCCRCFIRTLGFNQDWLLGWQTVAPMPRSLKPSFPNNLHEYQMQTSTYSFIDMYGFRWQLLWN